jgi:hypothetical protein
VQCRLRGVLFDVSPIYDCWMSGTSKQLRWAGASLLAVLITSSPVLAASSKAARVRVQVTTKVDYKITYFFEKTATQADPDVLRDQGVTHFVAEQSQLMDTFVDPRTKRREYLVVSAPGLRTDRTTGQVDASGDVFVDVKDSVASSSYNVSSKKPILSVDIPNIVGTATREVRLSFGAVMGGQHNVDFRFKDPEAAAAVAGLPKGKSVVTQQLLGVSQGDPDFEKFTFKGKAELFGKPSPTDQPLVFQMAQLHPERLWLGLVADERAGHYLQVRYSQSLSRYPGSVEQLVVSVDVGNATFRPL